jgi:thiol-disulfide isomerase/thioredoxin
MPSPLARLLHPVLLVLALLGSDAASSASEAPAAPEFASTDPADWLNSPPLDWRALRGKVVLIEFWTFACWNCTRSIPWLRSLPDKLASDVVIVGVHTPEFAHEAERDNVVRKLRELGVNYPVVLDNEYRYWKALGNRYWPAFYLVDRGGRLRGRYRGETHEGDERALAMESELRRLLVERP